MFGSVILDVAIGMIFVFLLVSVICSAIREGIEALLKTRAAYLEYGIRELLNDVEANGIARSLYDHPLIRGLFPGTYTPGGASKPRFYNTGAKLPSYIPAQNFAIALMDIAARGPGTDKVSGASTSTVISLDNIRANIQNIDNPAVQRIILAALDSAEGDLNKVRAHIMAWFDSGMDRISGWYKRLTQWIIFSIGLAVAIAFNINTFAIADHLYQNDTDRLALVKQIEGTPTGSLDSIKYEDAKKKLSSINLPIGWSPQTAPKNEKLFAWIAAWIVLFFGWLVTALAASMGAPFWFDMLNKVMVIRSTVKPHEKSPEEASEDRQKPTTTQPAPKTEGDGSAGTGGAGSPTAPTQPVNPPDSPLLSDDLPGITDPDFLVDGCEIDIKELAGEELTIDEDLPPAEGGIEK